MKTSTVVAGNGQSPARVKREPLTYERNAPHSWFCDLIRAEVADDREAAKRLRRHGEEMDVELRSMSAKKRERLGLGVELRANPTTLNTSFAPPLWLVDKFSPSAAGGRILADLIDRVGNRFVLPRGISSVNVPRIIAGAVDNVQTSQGAADPSSDPTTGNATGSGQIVTLSGHVDVSQQLLDQAPAPGTDQIFATELGSSYNQNLEFQMLNGTGTGGQLLGLANVTGASTVAGGGGTTIALLWPLLGQMQAKVMNLRLQPVSHLVMAGRRWAFIASSVDSSNRPISSPGADTPRQPDYPELGGEWVNQSKAVGPINGCPVWQSGAILPQLSHPNANTDAIFGVRPKDLFLWESAGSLTVGVNALAGTLQARVQLHRYVAFTPDRYPAGVGVLTAIPAPANF